MNQSSPEQRRPFISHKGELVWNIMKSFIWNNSNRKETDKARIQQRISAIRLAENLDRNSTNTNFRRSQVQKLIQRFDSTTSTNYQAVISSDQSELNEATSSKCLSSVEAAPVSSTSGLQQAAAERLLQTLGQLLGPDCVWRLVRLLELHSQQHADQVGALAGAVQVALSQHRRWLRLEQASDRDAALALLDLLALTARRSMLELSRQATSTANELAWRPSHQSQSEPVGLVALDKMQPDSNKAATTTTLTNENKVNHASEKGDIETGHEQAAETATSDLVMIDADRTQCSSKTDNSNLSAPCQAQTRCNHDQGARPNEDPIKRALDCILGRDGGLAHAPSSISRGPQKRKCKVANCSCCNDDGSQCLCWCCCSCNAHLLSDRNLRRSNWQRQIATASPHSHHHNHSDCNSNHHHHYYHHHHQQQQQQLQQTEEPDTEIWLGERHKSLSEPESNATTNEPSIINAQKDTNAGATSNTNASGFSKQKHEFSEPTWKAQTLNKPSEASTGSWPIISPDCNEQSSLDKRPPRSRQDRHQHARFHLQASWASSAGCSSPKRLFCCQCNSCSQCRRRPKNRTSFANSDQLNSTTSNAILPSYSYGCCYNQTRKLPRLSPRPKSSNWRSTDELNSAHRPRSNSESLNSLHSSQPS